MDSGSFDRIARLLGGAANRRSGLKAAFGAALATGLGLGLDPGDGSAAGKHRRHGKDSAPSPEGPCKKGKNTCKRDGDCCTNFCKIASGKKKGKCRCITAGGACKKNQTCCGTLACTKGVCTYTNPGRVATGDPCSPGDVCKNAAAACVPYVNGDPSETYCLYPDGTRCGKASVCASGTCANNVCMQTIPNGGACTPSDGCADANASCAAYAANGPAGTFCLLPATKTCAADADCVSAFCTGAACADKCTVCASGCDYTTITDAYNALAPGGDIGVAPGSYTDLIVVASNITIRRCGLENTVDWSNTTDSYNAIMNVSAGATLTLGDLELTSSRTASMGLVVLAGADGNESKLIANGVVFHDHTSRYKGALGLGNYTSAELTDCTFTDNTGSDSYRGGAIHLDSYASLTATNCEFTGNKPGNNTSNPAGAISANYSRDIALTGCTFTGNGKDTYDGGAVFIGYSTSLAVTDCTFTNNKGGSGGALFIESMPFTVSGCTFTGNTATGGGGAIVIDTSGASPNSGSIINTTISSNSTTVDDWYAGGGGVFIKGYGGTITVTDSTISGNTSAARGGGIFLSCSADTTTLDLTGTTSITGNTVTDTATGGGSGLAVSESSGSSAYATIVGSSTRVSGNITPPTQCAIVTSDPWSNPWVDVPGCLYT